MDSVGKLNDRISIRRPGTGQDAAGQPSAPWVEVAAVWADVRHLNGTEAIRADAPTSVVQASIRIRRRPGIDASMRVVLEPSGVTYQIKSVPPLVHGPAYMDLVCEVLP